MKRSEMKDLLYDTLLNKCYLGSCLNDSLDDRDCDVILDVLEEAGMLPPLDHDLLDKYELGNDLSNYHVWEEENETK